MKRLVIPFLLCSCTAWSGVTYDKYGGENHPSYTPPKNTEPKWKPPVLTEYHFQPVISKDPKWIQQVLIDYQSQPVVNYEPRWRPPVSNNSQSEAVIMTKPIGLSPMAKEFIEGCIELTSKPDMCRELAKEKEL